MTTYLLQALGISLAANILMFLFAFKYKTDKLTDASYALTFIILAVCGHSRANINLASFMLFAIITLWALRIGSFLVVRIWRTGKDARFDKMRNSFWSFGQFWVLQAVTVWVVLIPSLLAFSHKTLSTSSLSYVGVAIWGLALAIEATADWQKFMFSGDPKNKGKWIESGLWRYSRHPNYLGEIMVWSGVYLVALPSLTGLQPIVGLISPLYIAGLLLFVSGVPLLEKSADKRWGGDKNYQAYKKRTSVLLLLPNKK